MAFVALAAGSSASLVALVVAGLVAMLSSSPSSTRVRVGGYGPATTSKSSPLPPSGIVSIDIYMQPNATDIQLAAVRIKLAADPEVKSFSYLDHAAAYQEMKRLFPNEPDLVNALPPGDLPTSFIVTLRNASKSQSVISEVQSLPGVKEVQGTGLQLPLSGANQPTGSEARPARVSFVLEPTWLPAGFSASGGGWVTPPGGLHVSPGSQAAVSTFASGGVGSSSVQVLFTLDYYGYHSPITQSIHLSAIPWTSPSIVSASPHPNFVRAGRRDIDLNTSTPGAGSSAEPATFAIWTERKVLVQVTAQGITRAQLIRFVVGLAERPPPRRTK